MQSDTENLLEFARKKRYVVIMTNDGLKQLQSLLRQELKPIRDDISGLKKDMTDVKRTLATHTQQLEAVTADMMIVQEKVGAIYDLSRGTYESNKREIDEIKQHLNMKINPTFGSQ